LTQLFQLLQEAGINPADIDLITQAFRAKVFRKGEYLLQEGTTCQHVGFVEEGLFMFFILVGGEERTTYTVGTNGFLTSLWSFLGQKPARENIRCIRAGRVWLISHQELFRLQREVVGFQEFYTRLLEKEICCIEESRYDLIALTAEERYEKLLRESPQLLHQIPLHYLAALLGITGRHLSRIRAKQLGRPFIPLTMPTSEPENH